MNGRRLFWIVIGMWMASFASGLEWGRGDDGVVSWGGVDENLKPMAEELAAYLGRMTGSEVRVSEAAVPGAIVLATAETMPEQASALGLSGEDPLGRESYYLGTSDDCYLILGATVRGLEYGIWDMLYRLGYRQYFPGEAWEIVPSLDQVVLPEVGVESPSYYTRLIWHIPSNDPEVEAALQDWSRKNRVGAGFKLETTHSYNAIRKRYAEEFEANPDFYAKVDGVRKVWDHAKFNAANEQLHELLRRYVQDRLQEDPNLDSISADPSDFGQWDNSGEAFEQLGRPSNQAVTLANVIAREMGKHGRYVGMYAYYNHQQAPDIEVEPNIIVNFATRFLKPGNKVEELVAGWQSRGLQNFGIREYYSVTMWDLGFPGISLGGNVSYLKETIPHYYNLGARFLLSESKENWGSNGLGYYVASRLLWDADAADQVDAWVEDFLQNCFGRAADVMREFYEINNLNQYAMARYHAPGTYYRLLATAWDMEDNSAVRERLLALLVYTRYIELLQDFLKAKDEESIIAAAQALYAHTWSARSHNMLPVTGLFHSKGILRTVHHLPVPAEASLQAKAENNPWKAAIPLDAETLLGYAARYGADWLPELPKLAVVEAQSQRTFLQREAVSFVVPANEDEEITVTVETRLVGLSYGPMYLVLNPEGKVVGQGQLSLEKPTQIRINAREGGNYRLVFEPTTNAIAARSNRAMASEAVNPFGVWGEIHWYRPNGKIAFWQKAPGLVEVAGEGKGEFVSATLMDQEENVVVSADKFSGDSPAVWEVESGIWIIKVGPPSECYFEDAYLRLDEKAYPLVAPNPQLFNP